MAQILRKSLKDLSSAEYDDIVKLEKSQPRIVFGEFFFVKSLALAYKLMPEYVLMIDNGSVIRSLPLLRGSGLAYRSFSGLPHLGIPYGTDSSSSEILQHIKKVLGYREQILVYCLDTVESEDNGKYILKTNMVDLTYSIEQIWMESISKSTRKTIRRSQEAGIVVRELPLDAISEFINTDKLHHQRIGHDLDKNRHELLRFLVKDPESIGKMKLFAAYFCEEILEVSIMMFNRNISHAWLTAKKDGVELQNHSSKSLLHWHAIQESKRLGCRYYDLCIFDEVALPGIASFKLGFSKEIYNVSSFKYTGFTFRSLNKVKKKICL